MQRYFSLLTTMLVGVAIIALFIVITPSDAKERSEQATEKKYQKQCRDSEGPATVVIAACSRLIDFGRLGKKDLGEIFVHRGMAYDRMGQPKQSIEDIRRGIQLDPTAAIAEYLQGNERARSGSSVGMYREYTLSYSDYKETITQSPHYAAALSGYAVAYFVRGFVYHGKGQHNRAIKDLSEAIRLSPKIKTPYFVRGMSFLYSRRIDLALDNYSELIKLDQSEGRAFYWRGEAYEELGQTERAIEDFQKAYDLGERGFLVLEKVKEYSLRQ